MDEIVLGFFGILLSSYSFASTCVPPIPPLEERVRNADAVFVGIVLSDYAVTPTGEFDREALVRVNRVFKGALQERAIVQYLVGKADHCTGKELTPLSIAKGEEKIFYVKKRGDRFFTSDEMGVEFAKFQHIRQDIEALPGVVKKLSKPWWDLFGWTQ